jgi:hypothetical protein
MITKKHIARLERERRQTRIILIVALTGILIVAGLLAYGAIRYNIVAEVNGVKITAEEWQERVKLQRVQMINAYNQYAFYQQNLIIPNRCSKFNLNCNIRKRLGSKYWIRW